MTYRNTDTRAASRRYESAGDDLESHVRRTSSGTETDFDITICTKNASKTKNTSVRICILYVNRKTREKNFVFEFYEGSL